MIHTKTVILVSESEMNPHLTMLQNTNCVLNFNYYYGKVVEQYLKTTFSVKKGKILLFFYGDEEKEICKVILYKPSLKF